MSAYTHCRQCGDDLEQNGRGFGANECCCDVGLCIACCLDQDAPDDERTEQAAARWVREGVLP